MVVPAMLMTAMQKRKPLVVNSSELEVRMPVPRCRPALPHGFRKPVAAAGYP